MKIIRSDLRGFPRIEPEKPYDVESSIDGKAYETAIQDYSFEGVRIYLPQDVENELKHRDLSISLAWKSSNLEGMVRHLKGSNVLTMAGVHLPKPDSNSRFGNQDSGWDWIKDSETLKSMFSDLAFKGPECITLLTQISGKAQLIPI